MTLEEAFARIIKQHRLARGLTQRELGFRCFLDNMTVSRIERAVLLPSLVTLFLLCKAMDLTVHQVLKEVEALEPSLEAAEDPGTYRGKKGRKPKSPKRDT